MQFVIPGRHQHVSAEQRLPEVAVVGNERPAVETVVRSHVFFPQRNQGMMFESGSLPSPELTLACRVLYCPEIIGQNHVVKITSLTWHAMYATVCKR
jgi:hypothetical protein